MHYPMPQSAREEAGESTLSWFILALNGPEPKERREPLRQILGTSAWGDDRVSRPEPGPER
jgi:hypothetical protein